MTLRIMHLVLKPRASGAEALVASLLHQLQGPSQGCLVSLKATEAGFTSRVEELRNAGVVTYTPEHDLKGMSRILHLRRACADFQPDVLFAHSVIPAAYARAALLLRSRPSIVSVLHDASEDDYANWRFRFPEHLLNLRSGGLIAVSESGLRNFRRRFGNGKNQLVVKNGINLDKFRHSESARLALRKGLGCTAQTTVLLHVGRISRFKRQHLSLQALRNLVAGSDTPYLCLFAGVVEDQAYQSELEHFVSENKLDANVRWLGPREDVAALLSAADVYLMPSQKEAQPVAVVEALQSGLPCVLSDIPAFAPFASMSAVWCVDTADIDLFASRIDLARRAGNAERDLSDYSSERCAEHYWNLAQALAR